MARAFDGGREPFLVFEASAGVFAAFDRVEIIEKALQKRRVFIIDVFDFFLAKKTFFSFENCHFLKKRN